MSGSKSKRAYVRYSWENCRLAIVFGPDVSLFAPNAQAPRNFRSLRAHTFGHFLLKFQTNSRNRPYDVVERRSQQKRGWQPMSEHNEFMGEASNEPKDEKLENALDFDKLLNLASGLVKNHPLNSQDLEEGDDDPTLESDFKPSLLSNQAPFDMNEMFSIASQMMSDPEFLESLSGIFNGANQEELTEEVMSFPINLPGLLNIIGGPPSGVTGGISPTDFSQLVSTLFQELNDLREQIQDMNENLLYLRDEFTNFIKKTKQEPDSLLDE